MPKRLLKILPKRKEKAVKSTPSHADKVWKRMNQPVLGMLVFTVLPFVIIAMDYGIKHPKNGTMADLMTVINGWQGLVAGIFALLAAVFTARAVVMQISSAEMAEQTRLEEARALDERNTARALMAARSVMPLTLNVLTDYANAVAKASITVLDRSTGRRVRLTVDRMPPLPLAPSETIPSLQAFILAAPVEMGPYVADLLSDLQLLSANASSAWSRTIASDEGHIVHQNNFEALIGRSAVLYARISGLYAFARRETDVVPDQPLKANIDTALRLWLVAPDAYPRYVEAAESYFRKATSRAA